MSNHEEILTTDRTDEEHEQETIDFRMISFSLGGREYGIDIMDVKEIAKVETITYVPNTASYVRGVYNLRGEIISIIDLRIMFNLPASSSEEGETEDVLFLRSDDHVIGVVVDRIDNVVGVAAARIQPPPAMFDDINLRYIRGVVESDQVLYVILDSDIVFSEEIQQQPAAVSELAKPDSAPVEPVESTDQLDYTFVQEALETLGSFRVCEVNEEWTRTRFEQWAAERSERGSSVQLQSVEDADEFLAPFSSVCAGEIWNDELVAAVTDLLPDLPSRTVSAWVIGAGEGREAYSLACVMRNRYPDAAITVWAHDADLLKISGAPMLRVDPSGVPDEIARHIVEGNEGFVFSETIRNAIYFEYHDVQHENTFPPVDVVLARDYLSFLSDTERAKLLGDIETRTTQGVIVMCGDHEQLPGDAWRSLESRGVRCYIKA